MAGGAPQLVQSAPPAWKLASEDVCGRLALSGDDVATVLRALAILDEDAPVGDAFDDTMPSLSPVETIAYVDLTSVAATQKSVTAAADAFRLPLARRLTHRRARVAQKRLLELIRGPAAALKFVHDARPFAGAHPDALHRSDDALRPAAEWARAVAPPSLSPPPPRAAP